MDEQQRSIVVIGGGTGSYAVLRGLAREVPEAQLTAIVPVSDSGGSTGRLRDELGLLPVGDARAALVAMAEGQGSEALLRYLFLYRFPAGEGIAGHNLGNLLIAALAEREGSEQAALYAAARVLRVRGSVLLASTRSATLVARYASGRVVRGESLIDAPPVRLPPEPIAEAWLEPGVATTTAVRSAIRNADVLVVAPGDLFTSIVAVLLVRGVAQEVAQQSAPLIAILNLMTKRSETHGMGARDHLRVLAQYAGRTPDAVLVNTAPLPTRMVARYAAEGEYPILDDLTPPPQGVEVIRMPLLARTVARCSRGDVVRRSLLRHDPVRVGKALRNLLYARGVLG